MPALKGTNLTPEFISPVISMVLCEAMDSNNDEKRPYYAIQIDGKTRSIFYDKIPAYTMMAMEISRMANDVIREKLGDD